MSFVGPVFWYDLLRMSRRSRFTLLRSGYACLLAFLVLMNYWAFFDPWRTTTATVDELARFAESFFGWFTGLQFLLIVLLTPAYVATAIADEKHRRTLEFILTTDLKNREIVLGKLASRLINLSLFILTGLPILSLMQLFGGVSPELLWCSFAATALTMISLSGLSIMISVYARRPRDAIVLTYLTIICYFAIYGLLTFAKYTVVAAATPSILTEAFDVFYRWFAAGNVFHALFLIIQAGTFGPILLKLLGDYAIFHGVLAVVTTLLAVWRIRIIFVKQAYTGGRRRAGAEKGTGAPLKPWKPKIGAYPMMWKEVVHEGGVRLGWVGQAMFILIAIACLFPAAAIIVYFLWDTSGWSTWQQFSEAMNIFVRIVGSMLASLLLLAVAVRAAASIGSERDRQTMDSLMASPLTTAEVLLGKWVGSMASMRWVFALLVIVWFLGVVTGGLSVVALPVLLFLLVVYSSFCSALGMFMAASTKTTLRAILGTVGLVIFAGGGHWFCCGPLFALLQWVGPRVEWPMFFSSGLTPPFVMGLAAFQIDDFSGPPAREVYKFITFIIVGLCIYSASAIVLGFLTVERFVATCGRITLTRQGKPKDAKPRMST